MYDQTITLHHWGLRTVFKKIYSASLLILFMFTGTSALARPEAPTIDANLAGGESLCADVLPDGTVKFDRVENRNETIPRPNFYSVKVWAGKGICELRLVVAEASGGYGSVSVNLCVAGKGLVIVEPNLVAQNGSSNTEFNLVRTMCVHPDSPAVQAENKLSHRDGRPGFTLETQIIDPADGAKTQGKDVVHFGLGRAEGSP